MSNEPDSVEEPGRLLSRRELLGASATLGTAAIASATPGVGSVSAQTSNEPRIQLGSDYAIDADPDGNGDLVLEHLPSGAEFRYDSSADSWNVGTLSTGGITDANDGQAWETLRGAGYEKNQYIPLITVQDGGTTKYTSSSYQTFNLSRLNPRPTWDAYFGGSQTSQVLLETRVDPGTDQADVRVYNTIDGETVVERTGITGSSGQNVQVGPTAYTPTTTTEPISLRVEFRNGDNSTEITAYAAMVGIGVKV